MTRGHNFLLEDVLILHYPIHTFIPALLQPYLLLVTELSLSRPGNTYRIIQIDAVEKTESVADPRMKTAELAGDLKREKTKPLKIEAVY